MTEADRAQRHGHPGQAEPRSHGETHHETRRVNLNAADRQDIEDLPMVGRQRAETLMRARPLRNWDDVEKLPGFNRGMVDDLRSGGAELG